MAPNIILMEYSIWSQKVVIWSTSYDTLRVCVVGLVPKPTPLKMLTFSPMHRFCSNMAHFKGIEALISDQF